MRPFNVTGLLAVFLGTCCMLQGCQRDPFEGGLRRNQLMGSQEIMAPKSHGTCTAPPQKPLRWGADDKKASELGCFKRDLEEFPGSWEKPELLTEITNCSAVQNCTIVFYDSVTGKPLFEAPKHRTWADFLRESTIHGWPSFRDEEVVVENVRVLADGEVVSLSGTHLGFNLPDAKGCRYQVNFVAIAGNPY